MVDSTKDFQNCAVELAKNEKGLEKIRTALRNGWHSNFFDTDMYTRDFERMAKAMHEIYNNDEVGFDKYMNIIMA